MRRPGFTMIEATVSVLLVGVMLVASLMTAGQATLVRTGQQDAARAQTLANELLAQIVQNAYEQPGVTTTVLGPEAGETRATFNDIDDFNGWTESPPADLSGAALAGFAGWTRAVVVEWITPSVAGTDFTTSATETGLKRITVTVTAPSGRTASAVALRSRQSAYDLTHPTQTTFTSWIGTSLQIGDNARTTAVGGVNPLNQVP
ncbi:MAG TPA: hypothetical protein VHS31_05200 [Tepidisphaeraceae bacterium]|jgi:MSHA pilin protein MshD|nr:hypothetical protein [Tepidisphaeraceae bacterium]